jgi:hypothetical protein
MKALMVEFTGVCRSEAPPLDAAPLCVPNKHTT